MSNIRELKIDEAEHIVVTYVDRSGLRQTLDLSAYIDDRISQALDLVSDKLAEKHERKLHGHQL